MGCSQSTVRLLPSDICFISHLLCRPANREELFNLRHAQARNIIERVFGILKSKFRILRDVPSFDVPIAASIVISLCAFTNFIKTYDPDDEDYGDDAEEAGSDPTAGSTEVDPAELTLGISPAETQRAEARRDNIAQAMWDSYQAELRRRGL